MLLVLASSACVRLDLFINQERVAQNTSVGKQSTSFFDEICKAYSEVQGDIAAKKADKSKAKDDKTSKKYGNVDISHMC